MATRVEVEWALRYGSNGRIAATPTELHRVLASARDAHRATYKVPDWCGVELLRGWAFVLVAMDRAAGGGVNPCTPPYSPTPRTPKHKEASPTGRTPTLRTCSWTMPPASRRSNAPEYSSTPS